MYQFESRFYTAVFWERFFSSHLIQQNQNNITILVKVTGVSGKGSVATNFASENQMGWDGLPSSQVWGSIALQLCDFKGIKNRS